MHLDRVLVREVSQISFLDPILGKIGISLTFSMVVAVGNLREIRILEKSGRNRRFVTNSELIQAGKTFFSGVDDV